MTQETYQTELDWIRRHLSHLQGEVSSLESNYGQMVSVLRLLGEDVSAYEKVSDTLLRITASFGEVEKAISVG